MKITTMLGDMVNALFQRPATQLYPFERTNPPANMRGKLQWNPEKCTGCSLCVKDCPADAIEIITIDKAAKKFVMRYHADRCTYCGQCVQNCRFSCIEMPSEMWELAARTKQPFEVYYGREDDLNKLLEKHPGAAPREGG